MVLPSHVGMAAGLPTRLTGLHWFVYSLGTPVRFTIVEVRGTGAMSSPPLRDLFISLPAPWERDAATTQPA